MIKETYYFHRVEMKYKISMKQKEALMNQIQSYLIHDEFGKSTIMSLYLDTPTHELIRNSMEASSYKEKLRIRSYGVISKNEAVFLELKKKYQGVVYKRRVKMNYQDVLDYIDCHIKPDDSQIMSEIDYLVNFYHDLRPSFLIAYEREAFFVKNNDDLRITFDFNIRYRQNHLGLDNAYGKKILQDDEVLLEIKSQDALPLWLVHILSELRIYPQSFSKYKTAYLDFMEDRRGGCVV